GFRPPDRPRKNRSKGPKASCFHLIRAALPAIADPVQLRRRSNNQTVARDGGGGHAHLIQRVFAKHFELLARLDHKSIPVLTERKNLAVVGPGRGCEGARGRIDALFSVNLFARASVVAGEESAIEQRVVVVAIDQRRRIIWTRRRIMPGDELAGDFAGLQADIALGARLDRKYPPDLVPPLPCPHLQQPQL